MQDQVNIKAILAILLFILPLLYKKWKGQEISLTDTIKCVLASMGLPDLAVCLYYAVTNPTKALAMVEAAQYLTIAILIIIYISVLEIHKIFDKKNAPPRG